MVSAEAGIDNLHAPTYSCPVRRILISSLTLLLASLGLTACQVAPPVGITLVTDHAEFLSYAETFNSLQNSYRLEVRYHAHPATSLQEDPQPDIVISRRLAGRHTLSRFQSLDDLFDSRGINKHNFYPGMTNSGLTGSGQVLLPLAFDLPLVAFVAGSAGIPEGPTISLDQLRNLVAPFNKTQGTRVIRLGFSPRWNPSLYTVLSGLLGVQFSANSSGLLFWNEANARLLADHYASWATLNHGAQSDIDYADRFARKPWNQMLVDGQALFAVTDLHDFLEAPVEHQKKFDVRWLSHNGVIHPGDSIVYAGIPVGARNVQGAFRFLEWLCNARTQELLIRTTLGKSRLGRGLCGDFSSLSSVNESVIKNMHPILANHMPPPQSITFDDALPEYWPDFVSEVLAPWIDARLLQAEDAGSLHERYQSWYQQRNEQ